MSARRAAARMLAGPEEWNRRRLQIVLGLAIVVAGAVVVGVVWSVIGLLNGGTTFEATPDHDGPAIAGAETTGAISIEAAQPGPLSTKSTGSLRVPQPSALGAAQVGTGFPRTARGALAQLIAIDRRAIESGSVVTAQQVITEWAAPGGPTSESWTGVAAVRTLLESAGLPANNATELAIQLDPAMGLILDRTPTVCIDFILTVTASAGTPEQIAVADCQRMEWTDARWVIAAGPEPTPTPSLWPGTQASYDVGYQWLELEP